MIYELRKYSLVAGGVKEYIKSYNELGRAAQAEILGEPVAILHSESGNLNQIVFLWKFESFEDRRTRRQALMEDARFTAFRRASRHLLVAQENQFLSAA